MLLGRLTLRVGGVVGARAESAGLAGSAMVSDQRVGGVLGVLLHVVVVRRQAEEVGGLEGGRHHAGRDRRGLVGRHGDFESVFGVGLGDHHAGGRGRAGPSSAHGGAGLGRVVVDVGGAHADPGPVLAPRDVEGGRVAAPGAVVRGGVGRDVELGLGARGAGGQR